MRPARATGRKKWSSRTDRWGKQTAIGQQMARYEADGTVSRVLSRYQMIYPVHPDPREPGLILGAMRQMNVPRTTAEADATGGPVPTGDSGSNQTPALRGTKQEYNTQYIRTDDV